MKLAIVLVVIPIMVPVSAADLSHLSQIEIFTDRNYPVAAQGYLNIHVYRLDAPSRAEKALSAGLPADHKSAKRIAAQRARQVASSQAGVLTQSYKGLILARRYGLDRLPAVVFDGGLAVVYGITDLKVALSHYRQWRRIQGDPKP